MAQLLEHQVDQWLGLMEETCLVRPAPEVGKKPLQLVSTVPCSGNFSDRAIFRGIQGVELGLSVLRQLS